MVFLTLRTIRAISYGKKGGGGHFCPPPDERGLIDLPVSCSPSMKDSLFPRPLLPGSVFVIFPKSLYVTSVYSRRKLAVFSVVP